MHADQFAMDACRHARTSAKQALASRRPGQTDDDALAGLPWRGDAVTVAVILQAFVDTVGDPEQRQLPEGSEVSLPEVVRQRGVDLLGGVDVAVRHPTAEGLRSHVDELDLVGPPSNVIG